MRVSGPKVLAVNSDIADALRKVPAITELELWQEVQRALNTAPRFKLYSSRFKDSYALASEVDRKVAELKLQMSSTRQLETQ